MTVSQKKQAIDPFYRSIDVSANMGISDIDFSSSSFASTLIRISKIHFHHLRCVLARMKELTRLIIRKIVDFVRMILSDAKSC